MKPFAVAVALCLSTAGASGLNAKAPANPKSAPGVSILPGGNAKAPIHIEADKLDYFEKEAKAVYAGNVVATQGDSKLTCSSLTIFMEKSGSAPIAAVASADPAKDEPAPDAAASSRLRHMDCAGPVTMISKTQTATGDSGSYDKPQNKVVLSGHVTLSDGKNVTKGDRLVYDMTTGQATVQSVPKGGSPGGRVQGDFIPGSADPNPKPKSP